MSTVKQNALEAASFGQRIAEDEVNELAEYFVETDQWRREQLSNVVDEKVKH
jgi:hypothetical protein